MWRVTGHEFVGKRIVSNISRNYPTSKSLLEKLIFSQLVKKFIAFYGTGRFITVFTTTRDLSILCQINPVHAPQLISLRLLSILCSHLHLGPPSGPIPSRSPTKTPYAPLHFPIRATFPFYRILLDLFTRIILVFSDRYRSCSSQLCSLLQSPVIFSLLHTHILLSTVLSKTFTICPPTPQK